MISISVNDGGLGPGRHHLDGQSRTLNIMTVNTSCKSGGAALVASLLHNHFNRCGTIQSVLAAVDVDTSPDTAALQVSKLRHWANVGAYRVFGVEGWSNHRLWGSVLREQLPKVDLVHLHNAHGYYLPHDTLRELLQRPALWTLHDFWLLTGGCSFPMDCSGFESNCWNCRFVGRYPSQWFGRRSEALMKKRELLMLETVLFSVPTHSFRERAIYMGLPADRVFVVENPVTSIPDAVWFKEKSALRAELGLPDQAKIALFVANRIDQPRKGLSIFLRALGDSNFKGRWCGLVVGHKNSSGNLHRNPSTSIIYRPFTNDRNLLSKYFRAADVFINPSLAETFGLVNIEALSAGCPVICSDLPVFRENGSDYMRYFPVGNHRELSRSLVDFPFESMTEEEKVLLGRSVAKRYSLDAVACKYRALYMQVMSR